MTSKKLSRDCEWEVWMSRVSGKRERIEGAPRKKGLKMHRAGGAEGKQGPGRLKGSQLMPRSGVLVAPAA